MPGKVEGAIRAAVHPGMTMYTPTQHEPFEVERIDAAGVALLLGKDRTRTDLPWNCWEGIPGYIARLGGDIRIGGQYKVEGNPGTLDAYLKPWSHGRATAGWVAVVLETAGVVEIVHVRPARVRLRPGFS